ncbi:hypothetical protein [Corynebacterium cystitidis]|uniref:hypothetical protein n=1 Tax=Corynebacterium cystitidis TaxID=35757 RepID=UPI00211E0EB5|nr:hypothetical protein [Corynebacterium cystitidis]
MVSLLISLYLFVSSLSATQSSYIAVAAIAWALAGILGIGAMAVYFTGDSQERASGFYVQVGWKQGLYVVTLLVLGVAVVLSAVHIGLWFGKA